MIQNQNAYLRMRGLHRDLGYFFFGLIISFAISGIAQNHRKSFDPDKYIYSSTPIQTDLNNYKKESITEALVKDLAIKNHIDSPLKFFKLEDDDKKLRAFFADGILDVDLGDGKGKFEILHTRPIIGQMASLHRSTNSIWIWYSDIFAIGILTIAATGLLMIKGKNSFLRRGYLLTIAGIVVPLLALFFLL